MPAISEVYSHEIIELVSKMLEKDPEKRITVKEILNTEIISKEICRIKEYFATCYISNHKKNSLQNPQGISFQQYLENKLQDIDEKNESNVQNKAKEFVGKSLFRYHSLPSDCFEIYKGNRNKTNTISNQKKKF